MIPVLTLTYLEQYHPAFVAELLELAAQVAEELAAA